MKKKKKVKIMIFFKVNKAFLYNFIFSYSILLLNFFPDDFINFLINKYVINRLLINTLIIMTLEQ